MMLLTTILTILQSIKDYLNETYLDWMPRSMCVNGNPLVITSQILGDGLIAISYILMAFTLWNFAKHKKQFLAAYWKVFVLFGVFIFSCGLAHVFNIVMFWYPMYWIDSGLKIWTGIISLLTLTVTATLLPTALNIQSPTEVERQRLDLLKQQNEIVQILVKNLYRTKTKLQELQAKSQEAVDALKTASQRAIGDPRTISGEARVAVKKCVDEAIQKLESEE